MKKPEHYTALNPPPKVRLACPPEEGRTRQSERDSADINQIVARYVKTGEIPVSDRAQMFADVSEMPDYRTALDNVLFAQGLFEAQPAKVRKEFDNDPAKFLDFCSDPENQDRMREMGLLPEDGPVLPVEEPAADAPAEPSPDSPPAS